MLRVIVTFGRERYEFRRFREQGKTAVDERVKLTVRQTLFSLVVNTITAAGTALVFGFGFYLVIEGELQAGLLIVLLSYVAAVYQPLEEISSSVGLIHSELVGLRASIQLLDTEPEVAEDPDAIDLGRAQRRGDVRRRRASATTGGRPPCEDVSFSAEPGQRGRDRRTHRRREDDARQPARALLRRARRADHDRRRRHPQAQAPLAARADQRRAPGAAPVLRHDPREHPLRPARRLRRRRRRGRTVGERARLHRAAARRATRRSSASAARSSPAASASASASLARSSRTRRSSSSTSRPPRSTRRPRR